MNELDLTAYTLSKNDKERLKDYTLKLISSNEMRTKEMLYTRIRMVAKILSDINEAKVIEANKAAAQNNLSANTNVVLPNPSGANG